MNAVKIVLTIAIVGALLGGASYFLHRADVQVQVPQPPQPQSAKTEKAPDYGSYATAKHPKFPGVRPDSGSNTK